MTTPTKEAPKTVDSKTPAKTPPAPAKEIGGPPGPEPTRYGDWENNGRCIDF
jgi:hypothetical protein